MYKYFIIAVSNLLNMKYIQLLQEMRAFLMQIYSKGVWEGKRINCSEN